jgi:hypothetical protein
MKNDAVPTHINGYHKKEMNGSSSENQNNINKENI